MRGRSPIRPWNKCGGAPCSGLKRAKVPSSRGGWPGAQPADDLPVARGLPHARLGLTPQRPLYRAWQQDPVLAERWRTEVSPAIIAQANRERAAIFFADESGVRSDAQAGTT
ncbi:MAG: hypothetical protein ABI604_05280 [Nitrospirota bacterium]